MADLILVAAGLLLILVGALLLMVSGACFKGRGGGFVMIGPFPLVFWGKGLKTLLIAFLLILLVLFSAVAILAGGR